MNNDQQTTATVNNVAIISGVITSAPNFSHEVFGEKFYLAELTTNRISGNKDVLRILISERLTDLATIKVGSFVRVTGQIRSHNEKVNNQTVKLSLAVFVKEIEFLESEFHENYVTLSGFLCKPAKYRKTPLGREIADMILAVNRPYNQSDYIPCICWGRNSSFIGNTSVGSSIELYGRFQSREYQKKLSETEFETRVAYEVSVSKITTGE